MSTSAISMQTAQRIANAWDRANSLESAMALAGIKTNDSRTHRRYRRAAEEMLGITLPPHNPEFSPFQNFPHTAERIKFEGTAIKFSDAHFWPNVRSPAMFGMLELINHLKPGLIIDNGDSMDGASISRHAPITFESLPSIKDEYEEVKRRLDEVRKAGGSKALYYRNVGNHCLRYEAKLAACVPEMIGMPQTTVSELFPEWKHNYSVIINNEMIVKHKWHCGIHSAYNNVLKSGVSFCTGHTHRLQVVPFTDFRGTRYGIETGTLADPYGPQFSYIEDNPRNWQQGFIVTDFDEHGHHPEKAELIGNRIRFRGKYYG